MKKLRLLGLATVFALSFTLVGCGDDDDREKEALESKVEQLEQQITNLEKGSGQSASDDDAAPATEENNAAASQNSNAASADTLETLEKAVTDAVAKVDKAKASSSFEENRTKFFELKNELEAVEDRLDRFDDDIEYQYKQGSITLDDYRSQERSLEALEDDLDLAEDKLEYTFGMDD